ncbi:transposase [Rhodococcus sp. IEGM 1379]|uniref:transposase n=1 Tax=Rhodococcus sp. IEGM 1379 TaxID=3047086 RepID=UPI0024B7C24C|nr:transposase [Rhodococcus sp. IEGM 1379]MDI9917722.1 transposase [Rhodococcus sp. IEGM 1379]
MPAYARSTARLGNYVSDAVTKSGRAISEVAAACSVSWWLVQACLHSETHTLPNVNELAVWRIGIDEYRFRRVRFFKDTAGAWGRSEPWISKIVDLDTSQVLGVVDGRDNARVKGWLAERPQSWRDQIEVVAIDPSAAFAKTIREMLPRAAVSVDGFHLVMKANDMVTAVRQRLSHQLFGRRGRKSDRVWAHRMLLLRGRDTLSGGGVARPHTLFRVDDVTGDLEAAWTVKELPGGFATRIITEPVFFLPVPPGVRHEHAHCRTPALSRATGKSRISTQRGRGQWWTIQRRSPRRKATRFVSRRALRVVSANS